MVQQPHHARGSARHHVRDARDQRAEVGGVKAVDVLRRRYGLQHLGGVDVLGQRQLHQDAVDVGIVVQREHAVEQRLLAHGGGQLVELRAHAGFLGGAHLVAYIDARGRIVAGQQNCQAGANAALRKRGHLVFHRGADLRGERFSVENPRGHQGGAV